MSLDSIRRRIETVQREIQSLQRRLTDKSKDEATKTSRIAQIKRSISPSTSRSLVDSKLREIQRLENDISRIQKDKADLTKQVADKTAALHKKQQEFYKEQEKEQKAFVASVERRSRDEKRKQQNAIADLRSVARTSHSLAARAGAVDEVDYDAFISHASEDKDDLVRPLADALIKHGLKIWYDEFVLTVGDSLRESIDRGLGRSRFGIVVLSPSFFAKDWPRRELNGLFARETAGNKIIMPLWHKLSKNEVMEHSPMLADRVALNTATFTVEELAAELAKAMQRK